MGYGTDYLVYFLRKSNTTRSRNHTTTCLLVCSLAYLVIFIHSSGVPPSYGNIHSGLDHLKSIVNQYNSQLVWLEANPINNS